MTFLSRTAMAMPKMNTTATTHSSTPIMIAMMTRITIAATPTDQPH